MTAGIGEFVPLYSTVGPPGFYQFLATSSLADFFTDNPNLLSSTPVNSACTAKLNCVSYFFSGGIQKVGPNPIFFNTLDPEADAIILEGETGLQIDYWDVSEEEESLAGSSDCLTWILPDQEAGIQICLQSTLNSDYMVAGGLFSIEASNK